VSAGPGGSPGTLPTRTGRPPLLREAGPLQLPADAPLAGHAGAVAGRAQGLSDGDAARVEVALVGGVAQVVDHVADAGLLGVEAGEHGARAIIATWHATVYGKARIGEGDAVAVELTRVRFNVDEYHRMMEAGILGEDDSVELIDGAIVAMSPVGAHHSGTVKKLNRLLGRMLGDDAVIGVQDPVRLADDTEPEPDIAVLLPRADFNTEAIPVPAEILVLLEVADTSLLADRLVKIPRYARADIGEVWLIDLDHRQIERHSGPQGGSYRDVVVIGKGQVLASTVLPAIVLAADQVLGSG
jgi:Uma2 family endonuclease